MSTRSAAALVIGLLTLNGTVPAQEPALVDLASDPAKPWTRPAISGVFGGQCFDCPRQPEPKLPLEITLESIDPLPGKSQESLVNILVRNVGAAPYQLPVGRDPDVALKPGNPGRREFWFALKIAGERHSYLKGQETYGAAVVPGTMMTIPPGGIVRVRFKVDIENEVRRGPNQWHNQLPGEVRVEAAVVDNPYGDNPREYIEHGPYPDAISGNALRLPFGIMYLGVHLPL